MAFEAEVWSTLENDLFDESGGSARIAGVVLNIAIISHSRQWVIAEKSKLSQLNNIESANATQ